MLKVLLLDDHVVVRTGYRRLIDAEPDMQVVAEASTAAQAYAFFREQPIDLAVVDISLRGASGIDAIQRILARDPQVRILVLSMHDSPGIVTRAMHAGALGYLTKSSEPDDLLDGIRSVARGRRTLSPDVAQILAEASLDKEHMFNRLTHREFEVLRMLVSGEETREIASNMHLSPKTVLNHLSVVRQKLEASSDIKLLRLAARHGLVDLQAV